jgi:ADP-ribose pyrophosphatase
MRRVTAGPSSSGITSEIITFYIAEDLWRVGPGGGTHGEDITVHEVPLEAVDAWLEARSAEGILVDPKVYTGLYFLRRS